MLDNMAIARSSAAFWEGQPTDSPHTVNGFRGTWKFSDHSLIPGELHNYLLERFHPVEKIKRIPLEDINRAMNEVWSGPGSMAKLVMITAEMKEARVANGGISTIKWEEPRTIDDEEPELEDDELELVLEDEEVEEDEEK